MNYECEKCQNKFRVQRLINFPFPSSDNYPVSATAFYCPFCGAELDGDEPDEDLGDNNWAEGHPLDYED